MTTDYLNGQASWQHLTHIGANLLRLERAILHPVELDGFMEAYVDLTANPLEQLETLLARYTVAQPRRREKAQARPRQGEQSPAERWKYVTESPAEIDASQVRTGQPGRPPPSAAEGGSQGARRGVMGQVPDEGDVRPALEADVFVPPGETRPGLAATLKGGLPDWAAAQKADRPDETIITGVYPPGSRYGWEGAPPGNDQRSQAQASDPRLHGAPLNHPMDGQAWGVSQPDPDQAQFTPVSLPRTSFEGSVGQADQTWATESDAAEGDGDRIPRRARLAGSPGELAAVLQANLAHAQAGGPAHSAAIELPAFGKRIEWHSGLALRSGALESEGLGAFGAEFADLSASPTPTTWSDLAPLEEFVAKQVEAQLEELARSLEVAYLRSYGASGR